MSLLKVIPSNAQHIGSRSSQQDAFGFSNINDAAYTSKNGILAVLCDGMGGMESGELASRLAVQTMLAEFTVKDEQESVWDALYRAIIMANQTVCEAAGKLNQEIGTTLLAALIYENKLYWVAAGDSRIYLYSKGTLSQLTVDHNYGMELDLDASKGLITIEEAESDPQRQALVSYLGMGELKYIDKPKTPLELAVGDHILLCSDGLFNTLGDADITTILSDKSIAQLAERLVDEVLKQNNINQDNVTVALLTCVKDRWSIARATHAMLRKKFRWNFRP